MKDEWYGDKGDLVKWGILIRLAEKHEVQTILQVAYYRSSPCPSVKIDDCDYLVPAEVISHFRNIKNAEAMDRRIVIMDEPYGGNRKEYLRRVLERIKNLPNEPAIVFLDPDTGLEPKGKARLEHVLDSELREIWHALRHRDVLVFYQHQTNRAGRPWIEDKREQFERAICIEPGSAKLAQGMKLAHDVAFFFIQRPGSSETIKVGR